MVQWGQQQASDSHALGWTKDAIEIAMHTSKPSSSNWIPICECLMKKVFWEELCKFSLHFWLTCLGVVQWNLSSITAGSPMVGTPINQFRRPINQRLIKDLILSLLSVDLWNGEQAGKKGGAAGNRTQGLWLSMPSALPLSYNSHQQPPLIPALM